MGFVVDETPLDPRPAINVDQHRRLGLTEQTLQGLGVEGLGTVDGGGRRAAVLGDAITLR
ncbi:hypothetical protein D3C78_1875260 [compost metagenome]